MPLSLEQTVILETKDVSFSDWMNYEGTRDEPVVVVVVAGVRAGVAQEIDNGAFYPAAIKEQGHWKD
jgi:hypothetical protein